MLRSACWAAAALLLAASTGCGDPCDSSENRTVAASEMPCSMSSTEGVWESHPFPPIADEACYWLEFRQCSRYEIEHPLGRVPSIVLGYTSFERDGSFSTIGSGNSFVIDQVSDSTVTVRNAQNQLFYLKLVLD